MEEPVASEDGGAPPAGPPQGPRGEANVSISPHPVNRFRGGGEGLAAGAGGARELDRDAAVVEFLGVVRGDEGGERIEGIRYRAYLPMAERQLARIASEGRRRFGPHGLVIHHVVGFVPAGVASLLVRVSAPHSAEGFEACRWYVGEIKRNVPVWKEPVFAGAGGGGPGRAATGSRAGRGDAGAPPKASARGRRGNRAPTSSG